MTNRMLVLIFLAFALVKGQKNDGDVCTIQDSNLSGTCTSQDKCQSARNDYVQKGIRPTFCEYSAYGNSLVCCADKSTVPETTPKKERPVWGSTGLTKGTKRVSERKCAEYSISVISRSPFIALLSNPTVHSVNSTKCEYSGTELIVGGENALRGEFPHMAAVGWEAFDDGYAFLCGGSLISPQFVLTAGHCLLYRDTTVKNPVPVVVRLGDHNIDPSVNDGANPVDVTIQRLHKHPGYDSPSIYNDIGLLELANAVTFNSAIRPACLWPKLDFGENEKAIATGWGVTNTDSRYKEIAKVLQKVSLSLLDSQFCDLLLSSLESRFWKGFNETQVCAGELRGGKDTCQGDSGSALQVTKKENQCIFYIIGVTSVGKKCAEAGRPGIYTRVAAYLDWIESIVWPGQ